MQLPTLAHRIALLTLSSAIASCAGQSQKHSASSTAHRAAASRPNQCYESSRAPSNSDEGAEPASSAGNDVDDSSCSTPESESGLADGVSRGDSPESEISRLWNEIRDRRLAAGLPAEPLVVEAIQVESMSVAEIQGNADRQEPKSQTCIDTCNIEASICKNAHRICRLAEKIPDHQWAAEKCNSGKASCKEVTQQCTDCVAGESSTKAD